MGQSPPPKQNANQQTTGTVINEVQIHQAEIVNEDLKAVLYILAATHIIQLIIVFYKIWAKNLKKKYLERSKSVELL